MIRFLVFKITGPFCGTSKEGDLLYQAILPALSNNEEIELDFEDVEIASSSFFNSVIVRIVEEFGEQFVESHVKYRSLKPRHSFVLGRSLKAMHA